MGERGLARAQNVVGRAYFEGEGVPKDMKLAIAWFARAARAGHGDGITNLAQMINKGLGMQANEPLAAAWFRRAAEHGQPGAQGRLGFLCLHSDHVSCGTGEAKFWLFRAAVAGDTVARQTLKKMDGV